MYNTKLYFVQRELIPDLEDQSQELALGVILLPVGAGYARLGGRVGFYIS